MRNSPISEGSDKSFLWSEFISKCEELSEISESLKLILTPHFESHTIGKVKQIIEGWECDESACKKDSDKIEVRKNLLCALYIAANKSYKECGDFLEKNYDHRGDSPIEDKAQGLELSAQIFNVISKQCSGEISRSLDTNNKDYDPVWSQCRKLSTESDEDLAKKIGIFFRVCLDRYLQEEFKDRYNEVANEYGSNSSDSRSMLSSEVSVVRPSSAPTTANQEPFARSTSQNSAATI
jgi:hypothetical protein